MISCPYGINHRVGASQGSTTSRKAMYIKELRESSNRVVPPPRHCYHDSPGLKLEVEAKPSEFGVGLSQWAGYGVVPRRCLALCH